MTENDIVAVGGELNMEALIKAYQGGVFPWPDPDFPLMIWACPEQRAILEFSKISVPKSLQKAAKKNPFQFTIDKKFNEVIQYCSDMKRPNQAGTWITPALLEAYKEFHTLGYAHSIEAWEGDKLIGGLYGVEVDGIFAGESMFYLKPNASKLALLFLIDHLKSKGATWMDIQVMTPHMEKLGAKLIPRSSFLNRLFQTRSQNCSQGLKLF